MQTPAAIRFVSAEPLLGPIDLKRIDYREQIKAMTLRLKEKDPDLNIQESDYTPSEDAPPLMNVLNGHWFDGWDSGNDGKKLDWVIVGGESGSGARPCNIEWIRDIVGQCDTAEIPVFVKQLGANIVCRNDAGFEGVDSREWPDIFNLEDVVPWIEHDINGFREEYQGADVRVHLKNRKGGDPSEWPEDLRIRQFPDEVDKWIA